jgi:hypothetical protein
VGQILYLTPSHLLAAVVVHFTMDMLLAVKMEYLAVLVVVVREAEQRVQAILLQLAHLKGIMVVHQSIQDQTMAAVAAVGHLL